MMQRAMALTLGRHLDLQFVEFGRKFALLRAHHLKLALRFHPAGVQRLDALHSTAGLGFELSKASRRFGVTSLDACAFAFERLLLALGLLRFAIERGELAAQRAH